MTTRPTVYLVWHIHHLPDDDGVVLHYADGEDVPQHNEWDDLKVLGVYATMAEAEARVARGRTQPGFRDEPDCFQISGYELGRDEWTTGFVTC
ncbi:DUF7336 domain-containing protein [Catellatospora tritici]|uniref:DUF7336 domain-containing protein n=1 Tax=Catellatospora tritici TaxID=2851566 RepID=UPI001C2D9D44|nr:hypothetical protein [Catellatospora tritici]MBV1853214.1 hypothetical protein [Catellatospora tritici]